MASRSGAYTRSTWKDIARRGRRALVGFGRCCACPRPGCFSMADIVVEHRAATFHLTDATFGVAYVKSEVAFLKTLGDEAPVDGAARRVGGPVTAVDRSLKMVSQGWMIEPNRRYGSINCFRYCLARLLVGWIAPASCSSSR